MAREVKFGSKSIKDSNQNELKAYVSVSIRDIEYEEILRRRGGVRKDNDATRGANLACIPPHVKLNITAIIIFLLSRSGTDLHLTKCAESSSLSEHDTQASEKFQMTIPATAPSTDDSVTYCTHVLLKFCRQRRLKETCKEL